MTHYALLRNEFESYTVNDIGDAHLMFCEAIQGGYRNETRWISRADFERMKESDPYVRYCWSFGNNSDNYLYSKEVEPWKKALHYAYMYGDTSVFREYGIETAGTREDIRRNEEKYKQQYIIWYCKNVLHSTLDALEMQKHLAERIERNSEELRNYLLDGLRKSGKRACDVDRYLGTNGMAGHYFGRSQWEFPTREVYEKLQGVLVLPVPYDEIYGLQELLERLESLQSLQRLESLQSLERLQSLQRLERLQSLESLERLQSLESLERLESLESFRKSYDEIEIKPDSVIYCDIPYKGTDEYTTGSFDHAKFYDWCEKQKEPVYVSEYWMPPERFECVAETEKAVLLSSGSGRTATERVFVPKAQIKKGIIKKRPTWSQLLFDFEAVAVIA